MKSLTLTTLLGLFVLVSCQTNDQKADAYGNFEATETTVAAETNGKIIWLDLQEGQTIDKGKIIAYIDTTALSLKRDRLLAAKKVIYTKSKSVLSQIEVINTQKETVAKNKTRLENLFADKLASQQQLDDVNGKIDAFNSQIESIKSQNRSVVNEINTIDAQIKELDHQIKQSKVVNPMNGVVLNKYVEANEITAFGKPLYKIANLDAMIFKGYISERQLASIGIGDQVQVLIDTDKGDTTFQGTVEWIASEAEFTPKIIQTKEERINLVYGIKVRVANDGRLKIGMPAELYFSNN